MGSLFPILIIFISVVFSIANSTRKKQAKPGPASSSSPAARNRTSSTVRTIAKSRAPRRIVWDELDNEVLKRGVPTFQPKTNKVERVDAHRFPGAKSETEQKISFDNTSRSVKGKVSRPIELVEPESEKKREWSEKQKIIIYSELLKPKFDCY